MMVLAVNEDQVTPGVTAFLIVAALGVTLFFLIRSMNKRICADRGAQRGRPAPGRVGASPDQGQAAPAPEAKPEHVSEGDQRDT